MLPAGRGDDNHLIRSGMDPENFLGVFNHILMFVCYHSVYGAGASGEVGCIIKPTFGVRFPPAPPSKEEIHEVAASPCLDD